MSLSAPLSIVDRDTVTVGNTAGNPVPVSDGGGSVTVDNPTLSVVGTGTASGAQRVHLSDESLAALENITVQVGEVEIKNDIGSPVPVSAAALPLPTGAATEAKQLPDNHQVRVSNFPATQVVSATDLDIRNLTSAQDSVSVGNFPATQQVSGTVALDSASLAALETINVGNFPATQVVSDGGGSLTVDGTIAVSNFPATQAVSATDLDIRNLSSAQDSVSVTGSVSVSNFPATQAVSGTVEITNDVGNPIPVSGTVSVAPSQADTNVTGAWAYAAGTSGTVTLPAGSKVLQISATSLAGGSFTVNGGAAITIPANQQFTLEPRGNLVAPTLVFTSTTAYVVEYVS